MTNRKLTTLLLVLCGVTLLTSCMPTTPIAVYMTATFIPTDSPLTLDTNTPETPPTAIVPVIVATATPAEIAVLPTDTPTLVPPTNTPAPAVTWLGSVVGPNYVAPATNTSIPADTASPGATSETPSQQTPSSPPVTGASFVVPDLDGSRIGIQLDVNLSLNDWNDAMGRVENLGVHWVKIQISWRDMQPDSRDNLNSEFFRRVEQYLEDANRRGLDVLVSIAKAPVWARSTQTEDGPPDNPADLAAFITFLLQQINAGQAQDLVGNYIDAIEVWNEPNLIREWRGTLPFNGAGYMQLFAPAYQAIRAYSSTIPVITAGLAPTGNSDGSVDDRDFLNQMYGAGLANYSDVVIGMHPYSWGNPPDAVCCGTRGWDDNPHFFFADTMSAYRDIMTAHGDTDAQIWITEFGYATWDSIPGDPPQGSEWMRFNDKWAQAGYTIRMLQIEQTSGYGGPVFLWNLNFAVLMGLVENRDERIAYSLVIPGEGCQFQAGSPNRTERPLFWMLYDAVRPGEALTDWCGVPPQTAPVSAVSPGQDSNGLGLE